MTDHLVPAIAAGIIAVFVIGGLAVRFLEHRMEMYLEELSTRMRSDVPMNENRNSDTLV